MERNVKTECESRDEIFSEVAEENPGGIDQNPSLSLSL